MNVEEQILIAFEAIGVRLSKLQTGLYFLRDNPISDGSFYSFGDLLFLIEQHYPQLIATKYKNIIIAYILGKRE